MDPVPSNTTSTTTERPPGGLDNAGKITGTVFGIVVVVLIVVAISVGLYCVRIACVRSKRLQQQRPPECIELQSISGFFSRIDPGSILGKGRHCVVYKDEYQGVQVATKVQFCVHVMVRAYVYCNVCCLRLGF